ncbi:hypothetical protein [Pseudomonas sp. NBRC 111121]|uniref:hypothetical protein n=1 Tax=Pseudomonas sp. NBRC 111121 TaxID=1661036 RepID=UPI000761B6ED|nr:hypothetical protein [Pseudomonas sp. NBRC 111121]
MSNKKKIPYNKFIKKQANSVADVKNEYVTEKKFEDYYFLEEDYIKSSPLSYQEKLQLSTTYIGKSEISEGGLLRFLETGILNLDDTPPYPYKRHKNNLSKRRIKKMCRTSEQYSVLEGDDGHYIVYGETFYFSGTDLVKAEIDPASMKFKKSN